MAQTGNPSRISPGLIEDARTRINQEFLNSRQIEKDEISAAVGGRLICKIEIENSVGCFKGRCADAFINSFSATPVHLTTASAGNFGLAMAYSARRRGFPITVYAAETASPAKLERMRSVGAEVILHGRDFDEAKEHARKVCQGKNANFVEDGHEPLITAGAGTIAMEICSQNPNLDAILVPLGNGALLAGMGCWFRAHSPKTRIIGVCAEGAPSMALSLQSHQPRSTGAVNTIADGIAVRIPVPAALDDLDTVVDNVVLVRDDTIRHALKLVYQHLGLLCEPAAVVGIAALLDHPKLASGVICTPITGGNATPAQLRSWIAEMP